VTGPVALGGGGIGGVAGILLIATAFLVVLVLAAGWGSGRRQSRGTAGSPDADPDPVAASAPYRRYLAAAARAGGSARDWDRGVRPVLAELAELVAAERLPGAGDSRAAAARWLGPRLWPLVDRERSCPGGPSAPGPGREALARILHRLDRP
jgi:hypothetical protein